MVHTPRLCIDGRAEIDFASQGMIAQELIDQLVSAVGEGDAASAWLEKNRTVLLSHPQQIFSGQLKRFNTRRRIGGSLFYSFWEKQFVKKANLSVFHRFRPADKLVPYHRCGTITTVLPSKKRVGWYRKGPSEEIFLVPSHADALVLEKQYRVPNERIQVIQPTVRRFVHHTSPKRSPGQGWILFLMGDDSDGIDFRKLMKLLADRYPSLPTKVQALKKRELSQPVEWEKTLSKTRMCFYLTARPFDWATLALEAMYFRIPTIFVDNHLFLGEALGVLPTKLSRFLVETPSEARLNETAGVAWERLAERGCFESLGFARQYRGIYEEFT